MAKITQKRTRRDLTITKDAMAHPSFGNTGGEDSFRIDVTEPWMQGATHKRFCVSLTKAEMLRVTAGWLDQLARLEVNKVSAP